MVGSTKTQPQVAQQEKENMDKKEYWNEKLKVKIPDGFEMSDKQTFELIRDLFEMVQDNNKLINLNTQRIRLLEKM